MIKRSLLFALFAIMTLQANAHVRVTPNGRMGTNDAVKFVQNDKVNLTVPDNPGPCAGFTTRMANPLQVQPGQTMNIVVQETINHPGRFYVQFSPANMAGFWDPANQLALVQDTQNNGTTTIPIVIPNINSNTATIRVIQEMDDQPGQMYVHCIDVNIGTLAASPTPVPTPPPTSDEGKNSSLSSSLNSQQKPGFGGCGRVETMEQNNGKMRSFVTLSLLLLPLLVLVSIRMRATVRRRW